MKNKTNSFQPTLFGYRIDDTPHTPPKGMSTPSKASPSITNRNKSYYDPRTQQLIEGQNRDVLFVLDNLGQATQEQISEATGIPRHEVSRACWVLQNVKKIIEQCGSQLNLDKTRTVTIYKIKED